MNKVIKLKEQDLQRIVKKVLNEDTGDKYLSGPFDKKYIEGNQETEDTNYNRLVDYLQPLVDQELIDSDIRDDILDLAQAYADGPDVEYGDEEDERRYDDRENYGTDDESRYDERNYKYGNNPDDDDDDS
jgi:hypothetical protein|tara:strand:+ start:663 stop:1052 length:390 start_codon:yes stop_codon:yes gene_type:complete